METAYEKAQMMVAEQLYALRAEYGDTVIGQRYDGVPIYKGNRSMYAKGYVFGCWRSCAVIGGTCSGWVLR